MAWFRGTQRITVRQWPLLGLLLVVSFLGHDLLMATVARAAPEAPLAVHEIDFSVRPLDVVAHMPDHHSAPAHPSDCDTTVDAIPAAGLEIDRALPRITVVLVDRDLLTLVPSGAFCEDPLWPPGTRRALLQVYRI